FTKYARKIKLCSISRSVHGLVEGCEDNRRPHLYWKRLIFKGVQAYWVGHKPSLGPRRKCQNSPMGCRAFLRGSRVAGSLLGNREQIATHPVSSGMRPTALRPLQSACGSECS